MAACLRRRAKLLIDPGRAGPAAHFWGEAGCAQERTYPHHGDDETGPVAKADRPSSRRMEPLCTRTGPPPCFAARRRDPRPRRDHRCRDRTCTRPQDQRLGKAALRQIQALAAKGRTVDGLGAEASQRATPRSLAQRRRRGRRQLTWACSSIIGAHDSGCLSGGPFSLILKA